MVRRRQDPGAAGDRRRRDGRTMFVPKNWEKTYFEWLRNIQPWCISRQLWWGHRIPAWYGPDGKIFVEETRGGRARRRARTHYGPARELELTRDEDVLDTWFSSALWPFSTLGWPDETPDLAALLSDQRPGHRLRHHLLLGRPDDDDGPALHGRGARSATSSSTPWSATRRARRCPSPRAMSSTRWS